MTESPWSSECADTIGARDYAQESEHTDARLIHGPLYEEAESIQKLPVLDAAASVGWAPRITLDELIDETALYYRVRDDAREAQAVPLDPGVRV